VNKITSFSYQNLCHPHQTVTLQTKSPS